MVDVLGQALYCALIIPLIIVFILLQLEVRIVILYQFLKLPSQELRLFLPAEYQSRLSYVEADKEIECSDGALRAPDGLLIQCFRSLF